MPNHKIHCYVDRLLFRKSFWRLHRMIDRPVLFLGKRHRVLFHDGLTSMAIAWEVYPNDRIALQAALVHVQLDWLCSRNPFFHRQLQYYAAQDSKNRKRGRTMKTKPKLMSRFPFDDFNALIMKLEAIRQAARVMFG